MASASATQISSLSEFEKECSFSKSDSKNKNRILIKMVPSNMKNEDVRNILERYGEITYINGPMTNNGNYKFPYRFAICYNEASMQAIIEGMSRDKSGIRVEKKVRSTTNSDKNQNESDKQKELKIRINRFQNIVQNNDSKQYEKLNGGQHQSNNNGRKSNNSQTQNDGGARPLIKFEDVQKRINYFRCCYCGKTARMCCQTCNEIYCSTDCQDKDWSKHKYHCFKKPLLIDIPNIKTIKITENTEEPIENFRRRNQDQIHKVNIDRVQTESIEKKLSKEEPLEKNPFRNDSTNILDIQNQSIENCHRRNRDQIEKVSINQVINESIEKKFPKEFLDLSKIKEKVFINFDYVNMFLVVIGFMFFLCFICNILIKLFFK